MMRVLSINKKVLLLFDVCENLHQSNEYLSNIQNKHNISVLLLLYQNYMHFYTDYYPHLGCYIHKVLTVVPTGLLYLSR